MRFVGGDQMVHGIWFGRGHYLFLSCILSFFFLFFIPCERINLLWPYFLNKISHSFYLTLFKWFMSNISFLLGSIVISTHDSQAYSPDLAPLCSPLVTYSFYYLNFLPKPVTQLLFHLPLYQWLNPCTCPLLSPQNFYFLMSHKIIYITQVYYTMLPYSFQPLSLIPSSPIHI